ncbi:MAG: hypothetical protein J5W83_13185 [Candidatus Accumulibacter sp.]|nr:hypothetical protein [Accumulibacter sp.]
MRTRLTGLLRVLRLICMLTVAAVYCSPVTAYASLWIDHDAAGERQVHLYFFWTRNCPHCQAATPFVEALSQAVLGGLGLGLLPTFVIGKDLQEGRLLAVLSDYIPVDRYAYAVYLPTRHLPSKVPVFIDFLVEHIGVDAYWDRAGEGALKAQEALATLKSESPHETKKTAQ